MIEDQQDEGWTDVRREEEKSAQDLKSRFLLEEGATHRRGDKPGGAHETTLHTFKIKSITFKEEWAGCFYAYQTLKYITNL